MVTPHLGKHQIISLTQPSIKACQEIVGRTYTKLGLRSARSVGDSYLAIHFRRGMFNSDPLGTDGLMRCVPRRL
jgi:hypothetical protein